MREGFYCVVSKLVVQPTNSFDSLHQNWYNTRMNHKYSLNQLLDPEGRPLSLTDLIEGYDDVTVQSYIDGEEDLRQRDFDHWRKEYIKRTLRNRELYGRPEAFSDPDKDTDCDED
jgi:hypothetical protein